MNTVSMGPESLAERAYRQIEEQIVTLRLVPGSMTTEQRLCESLGLGRTPVREAILRLDRGYLVTVLTRRGVLIRPIEAEYALMTVDVRRMVERLIVQRASQYADEYERQRFLTLAQLIEEAARRHDVLAFMRIDDAFNRLLGRAARHEVAVRTVEPLHCVNRRLGFLYAGSTGAGLHETGEAHARMMQAVARKDAAVAEQVLDELLEKTIVIAHEVARMQSRSFAS